MTRLFAFVLLCCASALVHAAPRTAFQARCEDSIGETLSILSGTQTGFRIENTVGPRPLPDMPGRARPGQVVLGLTRTESRVSIDMDFEGHGLGRFFIPNLARFAARRQLPKNLQNLKRVLEQIP